MSQVDAVEKSYNDLSTSIARLKAAGYDEQEILKLDPTSLNSGSPERGNAQCSHGC